MDELFGSARLLGVEQIIFACLMSFILSTLLASVYMWTFHGMSYSRSFVHTLVLGSLITSILIMAIGNNLARGLGILGTLALIRFRTPIRDPRDIIFLFASLAIGIANGAAVFVVSVTGTIFFCLVAVYLDLSPFASRRSYEGMLRFFISTGTKHETEIADAMSECCNSYELIAMREAAQGGMHEFSYHVRLLDPSYQSKLIDNIRAIEGVANPTLLMHRSTVEL